MQYKERKFEIGEIVEKLNSIQASIEDLSSGLVAGAQLASRTAQLLGAMQLMQNEWTSSACEERVPSNQ